MEIKYTLEEISNAASFILKNADSNIILFQGEMGGGKTTLIKALTALSGSEDTVSSPTFSLVNEYQCLGGPIYHFDMYRINNESEVINIGFDEYLDFGFLIFIEWPEQIPNLLPKEYTKVSITIIEPNTRKLTIQNIKN